MSEIHLNRALDTATEAARAAGDVMRRNLSRPKKVDESSLHDIKLELDVRCQKLIERTLGKAFPGVAILGEEGTLGDITSDYRWVVDPIDGTVNFACGLPHACVSIALQKRRTRSPGKLAREYPDLWYDTLLGVVFDPFQDELWTALRGKPARLNRKRISVSGRDRLEDAIVAVGFAKQRETLERMLPALANLIHRVKKIRILGAAALSMTYVASGRLDAFAEYGIRLWDIAAAGLIIESAGGEFWHRPVPGEHCYEVLANNGRVRRRLQRVMQEG